MTRPRNGCGLASARQVSLKTGSWPGSFSVFGSVHVGKFEVPKSTQPGARSIPDITALWQTAQLRLAGFPKPIELICATSRTQNVRFRKISLPRATDCRNAVSVFHRSKERNTGLAGLFNTPADSRDRLCGPNAPGPPDSTKSFAFLSQTCAA